MNLDAKFAQGLKRGSHFIQPGTRTRRPSEDGFTMVVAIFLLALFTLAMAVAAPEMAKQIQLDREHETMERGRQYVRAIQLYYRKFHRYPPNIDALVDTADMRFLRQKYKDPLTGKSDWRLIHFGEAKTQTLGFFGQPILGAGMAGGSVLAGVGPSGGNTPTQNGGLGSGMGSGFGEGPGSSGSMGSGIGGGMGSSPGGSMGSSFGGSTGSSFGSSMGSSFGGSTGSSFGSSTGSPFASSPFGSNDSGNTSGTQSGTNGATGTTGTAGTSGANGTNGTGATGSSNTDNGNGTGSGMGLGNGDQTFGGAGIVGVAPASKKQSIMIFKKKDHYNEWEFVYDPLTDIKTIGGGSGPGGMPMGGNSDQNGGSPNGFGASPSGNGFGGGGIGGPGSGMGGGSGIGSGTGFGGSGFGGSGFGGSGFGGNGSGGSSPTPQPQQQATPQQQ